jgi:amino acid adenylation domain-containing protein
MLEALIESPHGIDPTIASVKSLVELLRARAQATPSRVAYTFLSDGEREESVLTYGELDGLARSVGAWLASRGAAGKRVLLLYPPGLEYIAGFWGCLYAGAVAVPAYPPRQNRNMARLESVAADSGAEFALTNARTLALVRPLLSQSPALARVVWATAEEASAEGAGEWREPSIGPDALAFLQYTSGSTAAPKGVMVTHGNLLHNEGLIRRAFRQTEESVIVGWLPLYHDMGLIGNVLQPLFVGATCVLMSPVSFLQRPARWLEAITRFRATTSGGPNFAYDLCARKVTAEERATLDLSSWSVAFNGAEPVRAETLERFAEVFAPCGFHREALYPCYGLAESTLFVAGGAEPREPLVKTFAARELEQGRAAETQADAEGARRLVGCGESQPGQSLLIVNSETLKPSVAGEVGEIWTAGPSVAAGYWNRPEETVQTFGARLANGAGPFLRTGDLGFMRGGELFITGRLKDLIILRGRNLYPQDIERTAEQSHASLRQGCGAAFSIEVGGEERLVIVQEVERRAVSGLGEALEAIRRALAEEHDARACAVQLVKAGGVPKTSSGKIQRRLCRELFLSGGFEVLAEWREADATTATNAGAGVETISEDVQESLEDNLRRWLAARLGLSVAEIDLEQPLTRYGVDSLTAVELTHEVEKALGVSLSLSNLFDSPSIADIIRIARAQSSESRDAEQTASERDARQPLTEGGVETDEAHAPSHGQAALWFLHRVEPESAAYNVAAAVRLHGELDAPRLRRAFESLVERHAALRTTFPSREGQPVQLVHKSAAIDFEEETISSPDEAALRESLTAHAHRPFSLERGPLVRVRLVRDAQGRCFLLLAAHHIVVDFWSLKIMLRELGMLYASHRTGAAAEALPALSQSYTDYADAQRRALEGAEGERLWGYWRERLAGELPVLNLPFDHPRQAGRETRGAAHLFRLDDALTLRLKALSSREGVTLYVTLLAAYGALLARYTGQQEVVIGSPISGRGRAAHSNLVGYLVNTLPLRCELSGDPEFTGLMARARRTALEAFAHQEYPFALIVQRLRPGRDAGRTPLFQTMFVMQQSHRLEEQGLAPFALGEAGARIELGELSLESLALEQRATQFDLTLTAAETGTETLLSFEYNADLFDADTVARMAANFETLLRGIVDEPHARLSRLPLMSVEERRRLLFQFNDTARQYPAGDTMASLFSAQVERTPSAVALLCDGASLTYAELDAASSRLSLYLKEAGAGPEQVVAVLCDRTPQLVVTLLAVLKAGAAYLPLDPNYPAQRLAFMLEDAGSQLLVTRPSLRDRVPSDFGGQVVCVEGEAAQIAALASTSPEPSATASNLAYLIYTSGSTGRPKGVAIEHRSAATFLHWARETFTDEELSGVLAATSVCFDLSVFELFAPLCWGGKVILAKDALALPTLAEAAQVRLVNTVPSAASELVRSGALPSGVRAVCLAGEALTRSLAERIHENTPEGARLLNLYGPSEDTTYSTWAEISQGGEGSPSIGRGVANTQAYVLDAGMNPVPAGAAGELYLGGEGLARGYLNRPDLTAERFVPDPFADAGGRLYRTGDLVRWSSGGELEYLGRIDNQVKIRGFRIELGEIEAALAAHDSVRECVVVVREEGGDKRLAAYVVCEGEKVAEVAELRAHLRGRLPEYMMPSAFVMLDVLPLSPNGKVDRKALPAPEMSRGITEGYVAPRNSVEEALAGIWSEVLGVERVSVEDNFFELGGHSLLATRVMSSVHERFGVELPLRVIFETPTIAGLAAVIEGATKQQELTAAPKIKRVSREALRASRIPMRAAAAAD